MLINQKIAIGGVFVLADARFDDGGVFQGGKPAREKFFCGGDAFGSSDARLRVGIDGGAVAIVGDFEAASFEIGHAVEFVAQDEPRGQCGRLEARVGGRDAEEENFLSRNEDAIANEVGEEFGEPRAARENEFRGGDIFAADGL